MSASAEASGRRLRFEPALEGLRGFALMGMLCYHSQFSWAIGGFLPIATFFSLSGYLITSLFLVEWEQTGRIDLGRFWARRFRRLMPAALLTLGAMVLFGLFVATPEQKARLATDVRWSLLYVANWHFYLSDSAYSRLFEAPSPVHHFWSLAIEEQFYFAYPMVVFAILVVGRGSRTVLGVGLAALVSASIAWSIYLRESGASIDRIYYGSDTRASELLLGGLLAVALQGRERIGGSAGRIVRVTGVFSMGLTILLWAVVPLRAEWVYRGGFAAYTLASLGIMAAAVQTGGPVRSILAHPWVRWTGRVSYGAYLFHWPIFLWLSSERTGLEGAALFAVRFATTFGLAELSYRFMESPIRNGEWLRGWRPYAATPAAMVAVLLATALVAREASGLAGDGYDPDADMDALKAYVQEFVERDFESGPPPAPGRPSPRVAMFGDSTAVRLGLGLQFWLEKRGSGDPRPGVAELGCGLLREGTLRWLGEPKRRPAHCTDRDVSWPEAIERHHPDVAVVMVGPWDVCDRKLAGDDAWRHLGDPVLDERVRAEIEHAVDLLAERGTLVLWLSHPPIEARDPTATAPPDPPMPESDPARMDRFNELLREVAASRPEQMRVVDVAGRMEELPGGSLDPNYRPDGTHFSAPGALKFSHDWLVDEIERQYRDAPPRE